MTSNQNDTASPSLNLKFLREDNDNCRVYFCSDKRELFCYQLEKRDEFKLFACTRDGEPLASINLDEVDVTLLSGTPGETRIGREFIEWNEAMTAQPSSPSI
jgi:hypothetical protein